jgi:hypothetical protein
MSTSPICSPQELNLYSGVCQETFSTAENTTTAFATAPVMGYLNISWLASATALPIIGDSLLSSYGIKY